MAHRLASREDVCLGVHVFLGLMLLAVAPGAAGGEPMDSSFRSGQLVLGRRHTTAVIRHFSATGR